MKELNKKLKRIYFLKIIFLVIINVHTPKAYSSARALTMGEAARYCQPNSALLHSTLCGGNVYNQADYTNPHSGVCDQSSLTFNKQLCWGMMFPQNGGCATNVDHDQCMMVHRLQNMLKLQRYRPIPLPRGNTAYVPPHLRNGNGYNTIGTAPTIYQNPTNSLIGAPVMRGYNQ